MFQASCLRLKFRSCFCLVWPPGTEATEPPFKHGSLFFLPVFHSMISCGDFIPHTRLDADSLITLLPRRDVNLSAGPHHLTLKMLETHCDTFIPKSVGGRKKDSPFYNLQHDDIKCVVTYLKSKTLLSLSRWAALRAIVIFIVKVTTSWSPSAATHSCALNGKGQFM